MQWPAYRTCYSYYVSDLLLEATIALYSVYSVVLRIKHYYLKHTMGKGQRWHAHAQNVPFRRSFSFRVS